MYATDIEQFLRCGHKYYLQRIKNIRPYTNTQIIAGRVFHSIVQNDIVNYLNEKKYLEDKILIEMINPLLNKQFEEEQSFIILEENASLNDQFQKTFNFIEQLLAQYNIIRNSNLYIPIATEEKFFLKFDNIEITGKFDILTNKGFVEYKTKKDRLPKFYDTSTSLQNNIYSIALKHHSNRKEGLYIFISPKAHTYFQSYYNEEVEEKTIKIIRMVSKSIDKEVFLPASQDEGASWFCDYCGVKQHCEYVLRK